MLALTYTFLAYSLSAISDRSRMTAVFASLIPEIDIMLNYVSPLVRNGVMHSILFGIFCSILVQVAFADRNISEGFALGFISHLLLDLISLNGIMLLFPVRTFFSFGLISVYDPVSNLAILSISFFATVENRTRTVSRMARNLFSVMDS